jgi:hypothetical protein
LDNTLLAGLTADTIFDLLVERADVREIPFVAGGEANLAGCFLNRGIAVLSA